MKRLGRVASLQSLLRALVAYVADERGFGGLFVSDEKLSRFICGQELCLAQSAGQPKADGHREGFTFQGYDITERVAAGEVLDSDFERSETVLIAIHVVNLA
jgi:hypothetical protein